MTVAPARTVFALVLVVLVLAGNAVPVSGAATTAPVQQQPQVTELDLQASLTGELVVTAGWFELTAMAEGRLDTGTQETDLGGTYDVALAEPFGEFAFRGEVVGIVNASRVLLTFEGDASDFGGAAALAPPTTLSPTAGAAGPSWHSALTGVPGDSRFGSTQLESLDISSADDQVAQQHSVATPSVAPVQLNPFRRLGISLFDAYWQLATLVLGLVLIGLLPNFSRRVADLGTGDPLRTAGTGLAVVLIVPIVLLLLGLSLFGIPLALAGAAVYLVLSWVGAVYGRFTVGMWVLSAIPRVLAALGADSRPIENRWAGLLVGTAVVGLLVLLPVVGPVVESIVLLLGLGGVTRLAYRSYRRTERIERVPAPTVVTDSDDE
ncbi:hypothetical protein [Halobaculum limi]|uniref:hypothetical protein n=1 Tax=Halobaculum limi TaxID=3031916 RepID=UPI0024050904|nr:hypothetical protein [Halobaculum sp. YSMS11]